MNVKLRKGDLVEIITGREDDRGKRGEIIKVLPDERRVIVQAVNMRTKHQKQVQSQGRTIKPGKVRFEAPIDISNVMLVCPKCSKTTRISIVRQDGKSQRVCKKCEALVDEK
ncbi:MAG: 50S ribosomal protein L24 [Leptolinea sp.]|jgi:large subunit ribosomal protein L24|nr:50S ribosomal protein L24 [Leptolinea sp.]